MKSVYISVDFPCEVYKGVQGGAQITVAQLQRSRQVTQMDKGVAELRSSVIRINNRNASPAEHGEKQRKIEDDMEGLYRITHGDA